MSRSPVRSRPGRRKTAELAPPSAPRRTHALLCAAGVFLGLALAPATGLALPLVSYGRSNLVITLVALGILISVARAAPGGKAARV